MVRKVAGIVLIFFIASGIIGYIALGGLKKPVIIKKKTQGYTIAGVAYNGSASDEKLAEIFTQVKQYHQEGTLPGTLTAVYYDTLGADKGLVKCFVGVMVKDTPAILPATFSIRTIPAEEVLQAQIEAHFLVAPSPGKIQTRLINYAQDRGLQLESFLIEKHIDESNFILEVPIKTK